MMKKILSVIFVFFLSISVFAGTIADVCNGKCSLDNYLLEYKEISDIKQVEKFKHDCKIIANAITTYGAYYAVIKSSDIIDVEDGFAVYSVKFELGENYQISDWIEPLHKIKELFPSLSNTHFTPYDCENLLPEGQYLDKDNWIAVTNIFTFERSVTSLSALEPYMIYIQFSVEYNNKVYKSGKDAESDDFLNAKGVQNVLLKVPVDAKLENIKAQSHTLYGSITVYGYYNNLLYEYTQPANKKSFVTDMTVLTEEEYEKIKQERIAKKEAEKKQQEEIARQKEEARLAEERRIEEARITEEKRKLREEKIKRRELQNLAYATVCKNFVSEVGGSSDDLKDISLTINENDLHIFKVPISFLEKHSINEEIVIRNYFRNGVQVSLSAQLNEKNHSWETCHVGIQKIIGGDFNRKYLKYGEEHIKGRYDDDMADEIKKAFGKEGEFSKKNQNILLFILDFGINNSELAITAVCKDGDDIRFEIGDPHE